MDRRLNAFRPDLADARLREAVAAERYVPGDAAVIAVPVADLRPRPDMTAGIDTQALYGEAVTVFERAGGWCWLQLGADGYVGYVQENCVGPSAGEATHVVSALRTFVYSAPDMKRPVTAALSIGSRLDVIDTVETRGTSYGMLAGGGAVVLDHLRPAGTAVTSDYVGIAARFLETPYLWGGRSGFGIDCSGLVQLSMQMAGRKAPRDSDMQAASLGRPIDRAELARGDLVFWAGHVAILEGPETVVHASGGTMTVARERLDDAIGRIARLYGQPTGFRRLDEN